MKNKFVDILKVLLLLMVPFLGIVKFYNCLYYRVYDFLFLFLFIVMYFSFKYIKNKKINIWFIVLSLFYSMFFVFGTLIDINWNNQFKSIIFHLSNIYYLYSFCMLFYMILIYGYDKLCVFVNKKGKSFKYNKKNVFLVFITFVLLYLPYMIMLFPGLLTNDSFVQIHQALGMNDLTNHHPIAHTMIIKVFLKIGKMFGSLNIGVALYSLFQMLIMSLMFTYFVSFLLKNKVDKRVIIFTVLYYTIVPIFGFYSMTMWKDILFSSFCLGLIIHIYIFCKYDKIGLFNKVMLVLFICLVSLFRSNGVYISIALSVVMLLFIKNKRLLILLLCFIPSIICYFTISILYSYLGIFKGNYAETIGIPLRQVTAIAAEGLGMDSSSYDFINNMMSIEEIQNKYIYSSVDPIKFDASFSNKFLEDNKAEFFKVWFKLLKKYPDKYFDTYLKNTYGFWYIDTDGYGVHQYSIESNDLDIRSYNKKGIEFLSNYYNDFYKTPVIKLLLIPAFSLIVLLFYMIVVLINKKYIYLIPGLVPLFSWGTIMIATPVSYQSRYVFSLYTTLPFIIFLLFSVLKEKKEND